MQPASDDAPLGPSFYSNPYEYVQNHVRNMNNEIFLSEYQINNLYALLLIGVTSPWDALPPNTDAFKQEVDGLVERKIRDVKVLLDNLSKLYEDNVKRTTFNQIERLMSIIRATNKSIFIQKAFTDDNAPHSHACHHHHSSQHSSHQHNQ